IVKAFLPYGILYVWRKYNHQILIAIYKLRKINITGIDIPENCVLLLELSESHGEVLPGTAKYLLDLGYRVDVVMASSGTRTHGSRNNAEVFSRFKNDNLRVFVWKPAVVFNFFHSTAVTQYKHIIINTYSPHYALGIDLFDLKPVCMIHGNDVVSSNYVKTNKIISLVRMDCFDREPPWIVNSHYFGAVSPRQKSQVTEFIALGTTGGTTRRNLNLIEKICEYLSGKNITHYKIKIVGDNTFTVPSRYTDNIQTLGFIGYSELYDEFEKSDFILALIDPASIEYTNMASSSYLLSYGFVRPLVIHRKFCTVGNFTEENSVIYDEAICPAVEKAINMSHDEYETMTRNLGSLSREIYETSLNNLKHALDAELKMN
ncbi:MAG: hypothetical protein LBD06_06360, partial [Candidatus Accumulibacter sp.]|nr:hypothetical protein [Accumulibacter sp.]